MVFVSDRLVTTSNQSPKLLSFFLCFAGFFIITGILIHSPHGRQAIFRSGSYCGSQEINANFLFISVKSTEKYHTSRLLTLLKTWISYALDIRTADGAVVVQEMVVVTDGNFSVLLENDVLLTETAGRAKYFNANKCGRTHSGKNLTCKMQEELRAYFRPPEQASWFCHFDDDVYVNTDNLIRALRGSSDPKRTALFVGRRPAVDSHGRNVTWGFNKNQAPRIFHWFHGQAICLSQKMMRLMRKVIENDAHPYNLVKAARRDGSLTDDILISLYVTEILNISLTEVPQFYSQYDDLAQLKPTDLLNAITLPQRCIWSTVISISGQNWTALTSAANDTLWYRTIFRGT